MMHNIELHGKIINMDNVAYVKKTQDYDGVHVLRIYLNVAAQDGGDKNSLDYLEFNKTIETEAFYNWLQTTCLWCT